MLYVAQHQTRPERQRMKPGTFVLVISTLLFAATSAVAAQATLGGIRGTVTDSVRGRPLEGAKVIAAPVNTGETDPLITTTDATGNFAFQNVSPATYALSFESALLDSLEFGGISRRVTVVARQVVTADLAIPSGTTLRAMACPGVAFKPGTGALLGVVTDADGERPLPGARMVVEWSELLADSAAKGARMETRSASATSDGAGQYYLCGLPTNTWLATQVQHNSRAGTALQTAIADAAGVVVLNVSFSGTGSHLVVENDRAETDSVPAALTGSAILAGTIRGPAGQPLAGVQVRVLEAAAAARTNERGEYLLDALPAGTHEVEARQIGYAYVRRSVELRSGTRTRQDITLKRVVSLDSVRVIAQRAQYPLFETHRKENFVGHFLDAEQLANRHFSIISDMLVSMPGFTVAGNGPNFTPVSRWPTPRCKQRQPFPGLLNVVIDNAPWQDINEIHLNDIGAIEFYRDPTTAPVQFNADCGLIIVWTKDMRKRASAPE